MIQQIFSWPKIKSIKQQLKKPSDKQKIAEFVEADNAEAIIRIEQKSRQIESLLKYYD